MIKEATWRILDTIIRQCDVYFFVDEIKEEVKDDGLSNPRIKLENAFNPSARSRLSGRLHTLTKEGFVERRTVKEGPNKGKTVFRVTEKGKSAWNNGYAPEGF